VLLVQLRPCRRGRRAVPSTTFNARRLGGTWRLTPETPPALCSPALPPSCVAAPVETSRRRNPSVRFTVHAPAERVATIHDGMDVVTPDTARRPRPLRFLPVLAASVLATTAAFTFSSYMLAKLVGLLGLTRSGAITLDLLLFQPLVALPVLVIVLAQSDYAFSKIKATIALFAGHLVAYGARSYIDAVLSGQNGFPSADERRLVIIYGYLGWCIGPLVATVLLLMLSRPPSVTSLPQHSSPLEEPESEPISAIAVPQRPWGALGVYALMGGFAAYVLTDSLWFFVLASLGSLIAFGALVIGALWRAADRAAKPIS
jgi:hypothetical protein